MSDQRVSYSPTVSASCPRGNDKRVLHLAVEDPRFGFLSWETLCGQRPSGGLRHVDRKEALERKECDRCWRLMRRNGAASVAIPYDGSTDR